MQAVMIHNTACRIFWSRKVTIENTAFSPPLPFPLWSNIEQNCLGGDRNWF